MSGLQIPDQNPKVTLCARSILDKSATFFRELITAMKVMRQFDQTSDIVNYEKYTRDLSHYPFYLEHIRKRGDDFKFSKPSVLIEPVLIEAYALLAFQLGYINRIVDYPEFVSLSRPELHEVLNSINLMLEDYSGVYIHLEATPAMYYLASAQP